MTYDPWQAACDEGGANIIGLRLGYAKGVWSLDKIPVQTGPDGLLICILMTTAGHSPVEWINNRPAGLKIVRYSIAPPPREYPKGVDPYTTFLCVSADAGRLGQMMTFTSSSWNARSAFLKLVGPYLLKRKQEFPICSLGSIDRHDDYGNFDPTFTPIGWKPGADFADIIGDEPDQALLPEAPTAPELPPPDDAPPISESD